MKEKLRMTRVHDHESDVDCPACNISPFTRNNYYTGKLLVERDFKDETRYHMNKMRNHNLRLHGWGTVCGLRVVQHPDVNCRDRFVVIQPGLALDSCGRELHVSEELYLDLEQQLAEVPRDENGQLPAGHLFISLCYRECGTELMPVLFDECGCDGDRCEPNRIREDYEIVLDIRNDEEAEKAKIHYPEEEECERLYRHVLDPCPGSGREECLTLAVIENFSLGTPITKKLIDNWEYRPLLPSTHLLDELIRCILAKKKLTQITNINWDQGESYTWEEFLRHFVGDEKSPKVFEAKFSAPVYLTEDVVAAQYSPHVFQAMVVRHVDNVNIGHPLEVIPAKVWQSTDRTELVLQIDRSFADEYLSDITFDLYLTIRCNLIADDRGNPVDGNLLARRQSDVTFEATPPTGDGIPGGTFESWIRVRPGRQYNKPRDKEPQDYGRRS
jgi:hypothetical protein